MKDFIIRNEQVADYVTVERLVRECFWDVYRPKCTEHYVLHTFRSNADFVKELDFVMVVDGKIIGQNVFVKAQIDLDNGKTLPILTMGPICIDKAYQRQGYGKALLDYSFEQARKLGYGAVLFEGNYDFYSKSGCTYAHNFGIRYHDLPQGVDDSFFLVRQLQDGYLSNISGEYSTPSCYFVEQADVDEFDKQFEN